MARDEFTARRTAWLAEYITGKALLMGFARLMVATADAMLRGRADAVSYYTGVAPPGW